MSRFAGWWVVLKSLGSVALLARPLWAQSAKRRIDSLSYSISSASGSDRLNQWYRKYTRSSTSIGNGWRPRPSLGVVRRDHRQECAPRDHSVHFGEEPLALGPLLLLGVGDAGEGVLLTHRTALCSGRQQRSLIHHPVQRFLWRTLRPGRRSAPPLRIVSAISYDVLCRYQDSLGGRSFAEFAREAGVPDLPGFTDCASRSTDIPAMDADVVEADSLHAVGTPTSIVNGVMLGGVPDALSFDRMIHDALRKATTMD